SMRRLGNAQDRLQAAEGINEADRVALEKSAEELGAMARSGKIDDYDNPWTRIALSKHAGEALARSRVEALGQTLATYDYKTGDVGTFLREAAGEEYEAIKHDPHLLSGYRSVYEPFIRQELNRKERIVRKEFKKDQLNAGY